ncbi:putative G-protein coupled receptor Mth-like 3 [Cochliomyia hominivorax]
MFLKYFLLEILIIFIKNQMIISSDLKLENPLSCPFEDTLNITNSQILADGSYLYKNNILLPSDLVDTYDYEILYNGGTRLVPEHKRACICGNIAQCITLCSNNIIKFYSEFIANKRIDLLHIFDIPVTLTNQSVDMRNIIKDFEHNVLSDFCPSKYPLATDIETNKSRWTLFENGSLKRNVDGVFLKKSEYCFDIYFENDIYPLVNPMVCPKSRQDLNTLEKVKYYIQLVSILFLLIIIYLHFRLPLLQTALSKCFVAYLACVTLSFAIFSFINLTQIIFGHVICLIMGYLNEFLQLSQYTWLAIISYDIWKSAIDGLYKSKYKTYALIGYSLPTLMTFMTWLLQQLTIDESLKPGISENRCGLDVNKWSAVVYLYGYCLVVMMFCLVFFILTARNIEVATRNYSDIYCNGKSRYRIYKIYFSLFVIMGLSWFLDIFSYFLHVTTYRTISSVIDYVNALQGVYIFVIFFGRKDIRRQLKEIYGYGPKHNKSFITKETSV